MKFLSQLSQEVDQALDSFMPKANAFPAKLNQAMRYSLFAGGKRLRPALVLLSCDMLKGSREMALPAACAIEMVHTYSLIHDDLPSMDDDDLRRGKPTCHEAFDEATAILAGDGLQTHAFATIAQRTPNPAVAGSLVATLAEAAGPRGMVAGQMADMTATGKKSITLKTVENIHRRKTAMLIGAAIKMGAQAAQASLHEVTKLHQAGIAMGLAFQITDDLLDLESTPEILGKSVGKDLDQRKCTWPAVVGKRASRTAARNHCKAALSVFKSYGTRGERLSKLTTFILDRKK